MNGEEMSRSIRPHLVTTGYDQAGEPIFIDDQPLKYVNFGDVAGSVWLWQTHGSPTIPSDVGTFPKAGAFPKPGETGFFLVWMAPAEKGQMDYHASADDASSSGLAAGGDNPNLHATDSIDCGFIISGEVELGLPSGETRLLRAGSCWVQTGAPHSWTVLGTEPCLMACVAIGGSRDVKS